MSGPVGDQSGTQEKCNASGRLGELATCVAWFFVLGLGDVVVVVIFTLELLGTFFLLFAAEGFCEGVVVVRCY